MDLLETLELARAGFEHTLLAVTPDQWDLPTPCVEWSVRDLVNHVVVGNRAAVMQLGGASRDAVAAIVGDDLLGDDPVAAFVESADDQEAAFRRPGALETICHHPAGEVPGRTVLGFRVGDQALHGWDLARAIGADETIDDGAVTVVWEGMSPMEPIIGKTGYFGSGPSGDVSEDAPLVRRLLDLSGRRP